MMWKVLHGHLWHVDSTENSLAVTWPSLKSIRNVTHNIHSCYFYCINVTFTKKALFWSLSLLVTKLNWHLTDELKLTQKAVTYTLESSYLVKNNLSIWQHNEHAIDDCSENCYFNWVTWQLTVDLTKQPVTF